MPHRRFAPHDALARHLLPHAVALSDDGAHDLGHLLRVWANVQRIAAVEGGDREVLAAAVLLHDCVAVEKDSPERAMASRLAAAQAREVLGGLGWPEPRIGAVAHAIAAHSYSAGIEPETLEARVLQDADRLDAIGLIGVARCFYVTGRMGRALYDPEDPAAEARALDDARFGLDHFRVKLLRLAEGFRTATGQALARARHARLEAFLDGFLDEVG
ncbi:HD domain-containing protein [Psychromarinibacter sp. C21-152]|uniref:HD domain-containing protein n=1 Tax=Psychromarinibacter sediminicola TaxID=3033385 RepID=A0AAE3NX72_9RHOB|nr:HD domain-containing protein [Psychromarinibacter sediminicola]MDF0603777.1 HD domain-containing protein [Psychromarinibacter sediminicola]